MRLYYEIIAKYSHSNWEVKDSLMLIYKRSPWPFYIRFSMCILLQQPWDNKSIFAKIACDKVKTKNSPLTLKVKGSHDFVMLQGNVVARFGYTCSPEGTIKGNQYKTAPIDHFNHMKDLFYSDVSNPSSTGYEGQSSQRLDLSPAEHIRERPFYTDFSLYFSPVCTLPYLTDTFSENK